LQHGNNGYTITLQLEKVLAVNDRYAFNIKDKHERTSGQARQLDVRTGCKNSRTGSDFG
jgi:hypothetical protein